MHEEPFFSVKATRGTKIADGTQDCVVGYDPKFVDAAGGDWRIRSSSKAAKAGLLLDWMTPDSLDLAQKPRKQNDTVAIGCYQGVSLGLLLLLK